MAEILTENKVENGILKITTTFNIPQAFVDQGLDYGVAALLGYQSQNFNRETSQVEDNPQHPVDFIIDYFHNQLTSHGQTVVATQAANAASDAAKAQFAAALGASDTTEETTEETNEE